jgi:hypothetical protein
MTDSEGSPDPDEDLDELQPVSSELRSVQDRQSSSDASTGESGERVVAADDDSEGSEDCELDEPVPVSSSLRSAQERPTGGVDDNCCAGGDAGD